MIHAEAGVLPTADAGDNWFWGAQILSMNGSPVVIAGNRVEVLAAAGNRSR